MATPLFGMFGMFGIYASFAIVVIFLPPLSQMQSTMHRANIIKAACQM